MTDVQLVILAQAGDRNAAAVIVARYETLARGVAGDFFLPGGDTDDVLQEALIGVLGAIRDFDIGSSVPFRSFAYLCARRQVYTAITAAHRGKHRILDTALRVLVNDDGETIPATDAATDTAADPASVHERRSELALVVKAAAGLSTMERRAVMGIADGYTYHQIEGGPNVKWVDNAAGRGRRKLRTRIEREAA